MTKSKMTRALFLGAIVLGLFLAGCDTGLSPSGDGSPELKSGTGKGTVTLNVGLEGMAQPAQSAALTVKPTNLSAVTYEATFTAGTAKETRTLQSGVNKVELDPGIYTILVQAHLPIEGKPVVIAEKSLPSVAVQTTADTNRTVLLTPKTTGGVPNGTFSYNITVPEGLEPGSVLTISGGKLDVDLTEKTEYEEVGKEIAPGIYYVSMTLIRGKDTAKEYAGFSEALHIYAGLESVLPAELSTFTDNDFSAQVATPIALDFAAPATGEEPVRAISAGQYNGTVVWTYKVGDVDTTLAAPALFKGEVVYTAKVKLTANPGFTFTGIANDAEPANITHEGAETVAYDPGNGGTIDIEAVFEKTSAAVVTKTVLSNVPGTTPAKPILVVRPILGNTPVKTYESTLDEYAVQKIEWNDTELLGGLFNGNTVYTATVTLKANPGFTFEGLGENAFTYVTSPESVVTNPEPGEGEEGKDLVVEIEFPATALSNAQQALAALAVNAEGKDPVAKATGLNEVTVTGDAVISAPSKTLRAGVTLAVTGKLTVAASATLNVQGTFAPGSGTLEVQGEGVAKGKFVTAGQGSVSVGNSVTHFNTVTGATSGGNLAVAVSGLTLTEPVTLAGGTRLTVADNASLTVTGLISGGGSVSTGTANSKVVLNSAANNGANLVWALNQSGTIANLELGAATTLPDAGQAATLTVKAGTKLTLASGLLTVPANKTLNVLGTITGAGTVVTSGTTGKIALASATVADNNENLKWALSKTGTLNFTLETAATLTGSNAVTANLTVNAALIVNEGTLTVTTGTLVPEGTGTLTTGTGGKVLLNKTQNNPNFAWALTNAGNPLALDVGADTNAIGTVKQGTVVTVVDSFKLTVPTATAFTVEGDLKLPGTGTLDVIGTIAGAGTVSTDGSGTVDLSNTAAVTTNGLNLKWALDAGATKLDLKQPATAAANTAIGKVTLDLTAALTVPQGGTLAIATAEGKVSATLGGSEKLVAAGAETGGTVTLLADGETLHAGLTTGAGVAGTALKAAVDALVADAAKLVDTVTLDSVAFAGVEGTAVGTTTVTTNNTGVAVWTATDGTQNSGAAVKLADDTTFADDGGAATGATGDISNAETFLASLDSGALKLKDTGWVTSNAKKVLVEFTGLKIENAGVALPLGTFHIGLLTQRG